MKFYFAGKSLEVPVPTPLDRVRDDLQYTNGEWMLLPQYVTNMKLCHVDI